MFSDRVAFVLIERGGRQRVKNAAIANRATVKVGNAGQIEVYNHTGTVNVDVDVDGYYSGAGGVGSYFTPLTTPIRVTDTRTGVNGNAIPAATSEGFNLATALSTIPATASSVVANVTVIPGNANGFLTVYPGTSTTTVPVASDVNWTPTTLPPATALGVPNFTIADTNSTGSVEVYNGPKNGATINLLIDAFGYFGPPTSPVNTVALKATPNQVLNNGTSTSAITATVTGPSGYMVGDSVSVALVGTPAAACGTILPASIVTNAVGVASFTYTSSTTVGFCTVTATEAGQGAKGTATVDQVTVVPPSSFYAITVQASPPSIPANGTSTSTITATVTGQNTAPISGDEVMFSLVGTDCGTFVAGASPQYLATGAPGTAVETYTSSTTYGTCTVDVQEANQAQVNSTVITQTPVGYVVTLAASPSYVVAGGATPNSTLTATVTFGGAPAVGDVVTFTAGAGGPEPAGITCGTFTGVGVPTNSAGVAAVTYVGSAVSTDVGFCPVTATESATSKAATTYVTQKSSSSTANKLTVAETPATIPADGVTTSNVIATVTGSGTGIPNDEVMFQYSGASCGTPPDGGVFFGPTIAGGTSTDVYTASHTAGVCTVTATEANSAATGTGTITQGPVVYTVVVAASPSTLTGNAIAISTITATVTNTFGLLQSGDTVTFTATPYPAGACGSLSAGSSAITNPSGVATLTYTTSAAAGFCVIAATEAVTLGTGSTQIDQTSV
jgi:adhesin/invasin